MSLCLRSRLTYLHSHRITTCLRLHYGTTFCSMQY
ncbi:hypothetical protein P643_62 [Klebsiella phage QL]|uniref:Uncharacterized protein n=1 Tax=Klebsiella phage QL TaxID=3062018 RepID=A0AAX4ASX8_9CAUD|nr:hypothetical protein P643_62 [Klebsiella phage QL]